MQDIMICGKGKIIEGNYGSIQVNGFASCNSSLQAETIAVCGNLHCRGSVSLQTLECNGFTVCDGTLETENIIVHGSLHCRGSVDTQTLECSGSAHFSDRMCVKHMTISGTVVVKGDLKDVREVICSGKLHVSATVSADQINVDGQLDAEQVEGKHIRIDSTYKISRSKIKRLQGDSLELAGVHAKEVCGKDIVIGPACVIDHVDCSGTLKIDQDACVKSVTGCYTQI